MRGGAKHNSGSLKQGVCPPEAKKFFYFFKYNKSMFYHPKPGTLLQVKPVNTLPFNVL